MVTSRGSLDEPGFDPEPLGGEPARRGRRPHSEEESAAVRERILAAFTGVFAETGYHGVTVALVLDRAGISRGTYYRYFHDLEEPMTIVLERSTQLLAGLITPPILATGSATDKITGAVDGYLEWGRQCRQLLPSFYAGLHDPLSPVATNRSKWIDILVDALGRQYVASGIQAPDPAVIHVLLNSIEFTCYHHYLTKDPSDAEALATTRDTMLRVAVALLTPPQDWTRVATDFGLLEPGGNRPPP